ncbi:MAG: class I SAM-dependent methyltransferase, partial [Vicinamibacterales bacterium]
MKRSRLSRSLVAALVLGLASATLSFAQQQAPATTFEPTVGQAGKDVVWVPSPQLLVDKMLDMAKLTPQDIVMDLGSGDGRTVITAAKRGATAVGIEYNPDMVELSRRNARAAGVGGKATFLKADIFETDLSKATVITMFLLPQINMKLRPKILDLKPGTRVVSNTFTMEDWTPDDTYNVAQPEGTSASTEPCVSWCTALLWIVPAKVEGTWRVGQGELSLTQTFQNVSGTLKTGGNSIAVSGKLTGDQITFNAGPTEY